MRIIYEACSRLDIKRSYLVLHSYEFIVLAWLIIWAASLSDIWKAVAVGFTQHLIFDQLVNRPGAFSYFLTYRLTKVFDRRALNAGEKEADGSIKR